MLILLFMRILSAHYSSVVISKWVTDEMKQCLWFPLFSISLQKPKMVQDTTTNYIPKNPEFSHSLYDFLFPPEKFLLNSTFIMSQSQPNPIRTAHTYSQHTQYFWFFCWNNSMQRSEICYFMYLHVMFFDCKYTFYCPAGPRTMYTWFIPRMHSDFPFTNYRNISFHFMCVLLHFNESARGQELGKQLSI